jgi:hypothetical protein
MTLLLEVFSIENQYRDVQIGTAQQAGRYAFFFFFFFFLSGATALREPWPP